MIEITAENGGQAAGRDVNNINHISLTCPGIERCPHSKSDVPASLISEAEFKRLAGFVTGRIERQLLGKLYDEYSLSWRGPNGISRMWGCRALQYDSDTNQIKATPSKPKLIFNSFFAALYAIFLVIVVNNGVKLPVFAGYVEIGNHILLSIACALFLYTYIWFGIIPHLEAFKLKKRMSEN